MKGNTYVKGKLNLKSKCTKAQVEIKKSILNEKEVYQELKENINIYSIDPNKLVNIEKHSYDERKDIIDSSNDVIDTRTKAEKNFEEKKFYNLPSKIQEERQVILDKFKKLLDKQPEHFDLPKIGSG